MAGRPKKPSALKVLEGTKRSDRINPNEPQPDDGSLTPPDHLTDIGKEAWLDMGNKLLRVGVFSNTDESGFALLCDSWAEWRELREQVKAQGYTYEQTTATGEMMIRANPAVTLASDAFKRVKGLLIEFGMTPASRAKVSAKQAVTTDPLEEFMSRGARNGSHK